MQTTIDKFGRVVLPKTVRDDLGLRPGAVLSVELREDQVLLKPLREGSLLIEKEGVLVFAGAAAGDLAGALGSHRDERLGRIAGGPGK